MQATKPYAQLDITTDAHGIVSHAGAAPLVELADRLGSQDPGLLDADADGPLPAS